MSRKPARKPARWIVTTDPDGGMTLHSPAGIVLSIIERVPYVGRPPVVYVEAYARDSGQRIERQTAREASEAAPNPIHAYVLLPEAPDAS